MRDSRIEQYAPLTGVVAVALLVVGSLLWGVTDYLASGEDVVSALGANPTRAGIGAYLGTLSAFFLVWFAGSLRYALREGAGSGAGRLATVAFGGGLASAIVVGIGFSFLVTLAGRALDAGDLSAAEAVVANDLYGELMGVVFPICMAVMVEATAVVAIRGAVFPAWFGWLSSVLALGLLTPVGYLVATVGLLWIVVVGIWLTLRGSA